MRISYYSLIPREVDYRALQESLIKQGVPLPGEYSFLPKA